MTSTYSIIGIAATIVVLIVIVGVFMTTLYKRSTRDKAYVRTGLGGKKVVLDGGSLILPVFHSYSWVQLSTLRLEVKRSEADSLITADRMRADITAEFYVRVKPDAESIALAAQTLGDRTNDSDLLRDLVEAKFVDALRSVAATMSLKDLQEKRADFVKSVQEVVSADLQLNGLELESVSLTRLDQTDIKHFNPNNTFDAEGLTALTRITELRRRERNEIVRDTEVIVAEKDREAALRQLEIARSNREAELSQERDIANKTAATRAETARAEQTARQNEETARLEADQEIAKSEALTRQAREMARIEADIAVAKRSEEESKAKAAAEEAKAIAITAEEQVTTAKAVEAAERDRRIAVIGARKEAERLATGITVNAEAEKTAADNIAAALLTQAEAKSKAAAIEATGIIALGEANATAERKLNDARNALSPEIIAFEITKARIAIIPDALAQAMKPIEKIDKITIFDAGRMLGNAGAASGGQAANAVGNLSDQLLAYRGQAPVIDSILEAAGFKGPDPVTALIAGAAERNAPEAAPRAAATQSHPRPDAD